MRGNEEKDEHAIYTWEEFSVDCIKLAGELVGKKFNFCSIYGVPRGGVAMAVRLSSILGLPLCGDPKEFKGIENSLIIVDAMVDSGKTRKEFENFYFAALHIKPWAEPKPDLFANMTEYWIDYPWEMRD